MKKFLFPLIILASAIACYVYLDWGILQLMGVGFVIAFASVLDEKGPAWRQIIWPLLALALMITAHFWLNESIMAWGTLFMSALLFLAAISMVDGLLTAKSGTGSVLTFMFLGVIFSTIIGFVMLYSGLTGLDEVNNQQEAVSITEHSGLKPVE